MEIKITKKEAEKIIGTHIEGMLVKSSGKIEVATEYDGYVVKVVEDEAEEA